MQRIFDAVAPHGSEVCLDEHPGVVRAEVEARAGDAEAFDGGLSAVRVFHDGVNCIAVTKPAHVFGTAS